MFYLGVRHSPIVCLYSTVINKMIDAPAPPPPSTQIGTDHKSLHQSCVILIYASLSSSFDIFSSSALLMFIYLFPLQMLSYSSRLLLTYSAQPKSSQIKSVDATIREVTSTRILATCNTHHAGCVV